MLIYQHTAELGVEVVSITGRLAWPNVGEARNVILGIAQGGRDQLILDLSGMTYIDSMGLGLFISILRTIAARNGRVVLANPSAETLTLIALTRLHGVFEIFQTVEGAIAALAGVGQEIPSAASEPFRITEKPSPGQVAETPRPPSARGGQSRTGWLGRLWGSGTLAPAES